MPTINQLIRKSRTPKVKRNKREVFAQGFILQPRKSLTPLCVKLRAFA